tara:strand:- start:4153 stop:5937 length:1785 start_codon:yes stop_codon:yes gene_type:complete
MTTIKKLFTLLSKNEQKSAFLLTIVILISAILDVLGIASIIPLIALLSNPGLIETNILINKIYLLFNFNDPQIFLFYLGIIFFIFFVISVIVKSLSIYLKIKFSAMREYSFGKRLLYSYLNQSYKWFLDRHSSDLAKSILSTVNVVINRGLFAVLDIISYGISIFLIITLLFVVDPKLTLIIGLTLGGFYGFIYRLFSSKLNRKGLERVKEDERRYTALSNSFGSIKETKLSGLENFYVRNFSTPAKNFAKVQANSQIIGQLPRHLFEAVAFGGLLLIILYLMKKNENFVSILPILSLYVFAGYRLMPALQQLYSALTSLRFANASINSVYEETQAKNNVETLKENLDFNKDISLRDVTFKYPNSSRFNLNKISMKIPIKSIIGLVGETGSGKTTLVDVILGLLEPQQGNLEVDSTTINKNNLNSWQSKIGYVPQQIFLTDQSISSNIAFGIDEDLIDFDAVERASKIANLHSFVVNELPEKYDTLIGERGVRLSGGQRQRIGIARALYHNPSLLILDEATNALDSLTEKAVMDAVHNLSSKITIILIAHRLNTIKSCSEIFLMDQGTIIAKGRYDQLCKNSKEFDKFISLEVK